MGGWYIHLALLHRINELQLSLCNFDNLLDQASSDFVLNLSNPASN